MDRLPVFQRIQRDFSHHPPRGDQALRYSALTEGAKDYALLIAQHTPESPEQTLALRALQQARMWANCAIAVNEATLIPETAEAESFEAWQKRTQLEANIVAASSPAGDYLRLTPEQTQEMLRRGEQMLWSLPDSELPAGIRAYRPEQQTPGWIQKLIDEENQAPAPEGDDR